MGLIDKIVKHLWGEIQKCVRHPDRNAVSSCHHCKQDFCEECLLRGGDYCYCRADACMKARALVQDYAENPRFCPQCIAETTDETCGDLITVNFIGTRLIDETRKVCSVCGSRELTKANPLGREATYKVIWLDENKEHFLSRKLIPAPPDSA